MTFLTGPRPVWLAVLTVLLLAVGSVVFGYGQASAQSSSEWTATLGGEGDEFAHGVALTGDGGFVVAGETRSYGSGSQDGWLVKLNSEGDEQWSQTFGGAESDIVYAVYATSDGGFVLAGETHSSEDASSSSSDFWLIKADSGGNQLWERSYGSSEVTGFARTRKSDVARAVRQTSGGGFVMVGSSTGIKGTAPRIVRTDARGNELWSSTFDDIPGAVAYDVLVTPSGFVLAGSSASEKSGSQAFLVRTNATGSPQWTRYFGGSYNDEARSLVRTLDGGFALGGFTWSAGAGQSDFWLVKADGTGDQVWERTFGGVLRDAAHSLLRTSDGGFALAGWSESFRGGDRFWVVKTDVDGRLEWSNSHQASSDSNEVSAGARSIQQISDGSFAGAGWTGTIRGARDILVVKMDPGSTDQPTPSGSVVSLTNTGTANITSAAVGYDTVSSGEPLRFWFQGRLIDRDNPLPSGAVACTQPSPDLSSDSTLTLDQFGSFEVAYLDTLSNEDPASQVDVDGDSVAFDFTDAANGFEGSLSVVSESPCALSSRLLPEGPGAPVGLAGEASDSHPGTITLDWDDNNESDIFGYAVYVSRSSTEPFVRRAWLLSDSSYADSGTTDGASYYYSVSAINSWGLESPKSEVLRVTSGDFTPPVSPSGLVVATFDRTAGTAQLDWNPSPSADLAGYRVYRQGEEGPRSPVTALLFTPGFEDRTLPAEGVFTYSITAIDLSGNESEYSNIAPSPLDFFGSVLEVRQKFTGGGTLSVTTSRGRVDMEVAADTEIKVPNRESATLRDLDLGDQVAVSLKEDATGTVARQVHLVPTKTRNRHLAGRVTSLSESEIVIQPPGEDSEAVTFQRTDTVRVNLHGGVSGLAVERYVIVSFIATDGHTAGPLSEINVIPELDTEGSPAPPAESTNVAVVRGVFQGINADNANLILSSTEVAVDAYTLMTTGVSVGDSVLVEAVLQSDASLLARKVEHDEGVGQTAARTVLRGAFQGRDAESGQWMVSGATVTVDARTYADALPAVGQRVKVTAILRDEGTLYAREIENFAETVDADGEHSVSLEGLFQEITSDGAWNVGGLPVQVDANTSLSGRPSVGRRVTVTATAKVSGLLATEVSAATTEQGGPVRSVSIKGTVDQLDEDEALVVDGIRVVLTDLTKTIGSTGVGTSVRIKAELQVNGELLAREVVEATVYDDTVETRANPVDIEGRIERVGADGGLTVNGIPVTVSSLTSIDAALQVGSPVQVRGLLQLDGSVLAREIVGYGPGVTAGTEASVAGVVEDVIKDTDGQTTGFVIDEITVATDQLTRLEVDLTVGVAVVTQAIVINGEILAVTVEPRPTGSIGVLPFVQMQGTIERPLDATSTRPLDITVNGITVRISSDTKIMGELQGGFVVKVTGTISGSIFLAREIDVVKSYPAQGGQSQVRFNLSGTIEEIRADGEGEPEALLLAGNTITIVPLTVFQDQVSVGDSVEAEGIIRDGVLIAALIKLGESSPDNTGDQASEGSSS